MTNQFRITSYNITCSENKLDYITSYQIITLDFTCRPWRMFFLRRHLMSVHILATLISVASRHHTELHRSRVLSFSANNWSWAFCKRKCLLFSDKFLERTSELEWDQNKQTRCQYDKAHETKDETKDAANLPWAACGFACKNQTMQTSSLLHRLCKRSIADECSISLEQRYEKIQSLY